MPDPSPTPALAPTPPPGGRRPSSAVMRRINTVPSALLRSPLHRLLSKRLLLLTFRGRRSGKPITIPVGYFQEADRTLLLATERPWQKNLAGGVPVDLRLRGQALTGRADLIADEPHLTEAVAAILARDPGYGRFFGVAPAPDSRPNPDQLARAHARGLGVIRITLNPTKH